MDQKDGVPAPATPAARPPTRGLRATISLLGRNPDFRLLYVASLVSYAGDWFLTVALFGLVLELTHSALMASFIVVAQMLPFFLVSPIGGAFADRFDRQKLMVLSDIARTVVVIGFLFVTGKDRVWIVYALQSVESALAGFFDPASEAAVPNLVDAADLSAANALAGSAWGTMLAVGAALGGVVVATFGRDTAIICDCLSFAVSAALIYRIRRAFAEPREESEGHPGVIAATAETFRYARTDHRIVALLGVKGGFGLAGGVIVLLPVFGEQVFKGGAIAVGTLMGARGVGALIGPFLGKAYVRDDERRLFVAIGVALTAFAVFYAGFPLMPAIWLGVPLVIGAHLGGGAQWSLSTYGLQKIVPDRIRGRVLAFDVALITFTLALSNLAAGFVATRFGPRVALEGLVGVSLLYAGIWWLATSRVRRSPA